MKSQTTPLPYPAGDILLEEREPPPHCLVRYRRMLTEGSRRI